MQWCIILYYTHLSEFDQTKRRHHRPYTLDEGNALGLAIPLPQGAMGAAGRHGRGSERSPKLGGGGVRTAVRCDTPTVETEWTSENPLKSGTLEEERLLLFDVWVCVTACLGATVILIILVF